MLTFLLIAGGGALAAALVMVSPLLAARGTATGRDAADTRIFRDQLDEIGRDLARGTITEAEAEGARVEVSRRLIAAAGRAETAEALVPAPRWLSRIAAGSAVIGALGVTAFVYGQVGAPGQPDLPLTSRSLLDPMIADAGRPSQEEAEARALAADILPPAQDDPRVDELLARLKSVLEDRPDDVRGHRLMARSLAQSGRWVEARKAYDRLIEIIGPGTDADTHANRAEAMMFAAGGYVSPAAARALADALRLEPEHAISRYYIAFAFRQTGRPEAAARIWRGLLIEDRNADEPRGAGWRDALAGLISETMGGPRQATGAPGAPGGGGDGLAGPTREDVEDAAALTAEERSERINAMVARLDKRLTTTGGEPEEWVRLINAYVQLDRIDDAQRVLGRSQAALADRTAAGFVRERALLLGVELGVGSQ